MTSDRELMQQALEALTYIHTETTAYEDELIHAAIAALRERLAQKENPDGLQTTGPLTDRTDHVRNGGDYTPEPVAMRYDFDGYGYRYIDSGSGSNWQTRIKDAEPLYASPSQPDTKVNSEAIPKQISEPVCAHGVGKTKCDFCRVEDKQPEQEPVGEIVQAFADLTAVSIPVMPPVGTKLYTTPPRREWVGLMDEEIDQGLVRTNYAMQTAGAWRDGVEWAQAQLKEKNT